MNMQSNADFLKKLAGIFLVEAREHVQALGAGLLELQKAVDQDQQLPIVEKLYRETHSLKGAARSVDASEIELLCQTLESAFGSIKSGKLLLSDEVLEELHRTTAVLGKLTDALESGNQLQPAAAGGVAVLQQTALNAQSSTSGPVSGAISNEPVLAGANRAHIPVTTLAQSSATGTVRIATGKLDAIFTQAEEMMEVKLAQAERLSELRALAGLISDSNRLWGLALPLVQALRQQTGFRADGPEQASGLPALQSRLLDFLDQDLEHREGIKVFVADLVHTVISDQRRFAALADHLLEDVKKALMLPFSIILAGFPKMIHDLARDAGKELVFNMSGTDVEIDKRILENIKDPLVHLVRNSVAHGIELPSGRIRCGKQAGGNLTLSITQSGSKVEILVSDDGAGVDVAAVKTAAVQAGVIAADEAAALNDQDARQLVFRSGVTTGREVTALSGRGLGMAIVQEYVAKVGGTVTIDSAAGAGTTVRIVIPLTLSTLRGTLVGVGNREFVIPTANLARVVRIERTAVRRVENRDSIYLDGATLAVVSLADVLGLASGRSAGGSTAELTLLILEHARTRIAFAVDQVISEQEVLAKPLGRLLPRVRNLAGATLLGMGRVVPILSVPDLLQSANGCGQTASASGVQAETARIRSVLVVDDSITARTLLQNILESAGYAVKTAPDGVAAVNMLRSEPFDLVVTDLEMPRMNGFELTKRLRGEPGLAALPVVLVTAREAKEDRERGIAAGADAYIVKSNFEQSNLLEVIGRLL